MTKSNKDENSSPRRGGPTRPLYLYAFVLCRLHTAIKGCKLKAFIVIFYCVFDSVISSTIFIIYMYNMYTATNDMCVIVFHVSEKSSRILVINKLLLNFVQYRVRSVRRTEGLKRNVGRYTLCFVLVWNGIISF